MDPEDLIAEMLEDFAKLSGEDLGDIISEGLEQEDSAGGEWRESDLNEIGTEDTIEDNFDSRSHAGDVDDYLDGLWDDIDVDAGEADYYGDE